MTGKRQSRKIIKRNWKSGKPEPGEGGSDRDYEIGGRLNKD